MKRSLSLYEQRIIGALIEKEMTTPNHYPLSLNALTNACNQTSNRLPVLKLSESTVNEALQGLIEKGLVYADSYRSRVEKYAHRFCNSEFGELQLPAHCVAILAELLLRGPQTPGELRPRATRMSPLPSLEMVESALQTLAEHPLGPLVAVLPREAGKRESRYQHCFAEVGDGNTEPPEGAVGSVRPSSSQSSHLSSQEPSLQAALAEAAELKTKCERLQAENEDLKRRLRALGEVC